MSTRYKDRFVLVRSVNTGQVRWERQASNGRIRGGGTDHSKWYVRKSAMLANLRSTNIRWWRLDIVDRTGVGEDASRKATETAPEGYGTRKASAARL